MAQEPSLSRLSIDTQKRTNLDTSSPSTQPGVVLDKSSSSGSVPRRSPRVLNSASDMSPTTKQQGRRCTRPKSVSFGPQKGPSRGSAAGVADTTRAASHTPKMKCVSKAKKGKKVHACDFGCGRVFTRKEHQKRHEANHRPEYEFPCLVEGCQKAFQRKDLLIRHMDKQHNMIMKSSDIKSPPTRPSARESFSPVSERSTSTRGPVPREEPLTTASRSTIPLSGGHLLRPLDIQDGFAPIYPLQLSLEVSQLSLAADLCDSIPAIPDLVYGPFPPCRMYSSSCSSPMSDRPYPQNFPTQLFPLGVKSQSISSASSTEPTWGDLDIGLPAGHFGGAFEEGSFLPPVGIPAPSWPFPRHLPDFFIEPSLPVSVSCVDGDEYLALWRAQVDEIDAPSQVDEEDALFQTDVEQTQHYLECYRKCFDPLFPILHYPTAKTGLSQRSIVAAAMIAIGAQFSPRENAKPFSASLHEKCVKILAEHREPITSRSKISDQQSVILLEAFSCYRGRSRTVQMSSEFKTLYTSLLNERERLKTYPPIYAGSSYLNDCDPKFEKARKNWVNHETKRRLLLAAFILDTHQYAFFQEPSCYSPGVSKSLDLPSLCSSEVWECSDAKEWRRLVRHHTAIDLTRLQNGKFDIPASSINAFESSIIQCCQIQIQTRLLTNPSPSIPTPPSLTILPSAFPTARESLFTHHALRLASLTPIRHLLLVTGESWLFGTKVPDSRLWHDAKSRLRAWLSTPSAPQAVWHATHALRLALPLPDHDQDNPAGLHILHEQWCIYLAALVCWAFGYAPLGMRRDPLLWTWPTAQEYLAAMHVERWQDVSAVPERAYTRGLLEGVRERLVGGGKGVVEQKERMRLMRPMGRLLVEAMEVLGALAEGRSMLVDFYEGGLGGSGVVGEEWVEEYS